MTTTRDPRWLFVYARSEKLITKVLNRRAKRREHELDRRATKWRE